MCKNGVWGSEPEGEEGIICVRVADFDRERSLVNLEDPTYRFIKPSKKNDRVLQSGDLLLEKSGGGRISLLVSLSYMTMMKMRFVLTLLLECQLLTTRFKVLELPE